MFNHRFFSHQAVFDVQVERAQAPLETSPRFVSFGLFVHDFLGWFEEQPLLQSVKLACVAMPEVEQSPVGVRIRHHFVLSSIGGSVPSTEDYALVHLPWNLMGNGVFEIARTDKQVQAYLKMSDDSDSLSYQSLVYDLALRVNASFEDIHVVHDVGLSSSTR